MGQNSKILFTADFHFGHINQLDHHPKRMEVLGISNDDLVNLPMAEVALKTDKALIDLWNSNVSKHDIVYHIGDFCLGNKARTEYILRRLNGRKFFIMGNHDKSLIGNENYLSGLWELKEAKFNNTNFPFIKEGETFCVELSHTPQLAWNRRPHGACHVHGHTHGAIDKYNEDSLELRVDVGLDGALANYGFVTLEKLYAHFYGIVNMAGCSNFKEYAEWLMEKQGFRM